MPVIERWRGIVREYRRLRRLMGGASYGRTEAFARAIARAERDKRHA
jgi:hypothetical protein